MPVLTVSADWTPVSVTDPYNSARSSTNGGYARYAPTSVKLLTDSPAAGTTLPAVATHAIITVKGQPIRWRADGTAPTASEGHYMAAGESLVIEGSPLWLRRFQFIDTAAGASEVTVTYFY